MRESQQVIHLGMICMDIMESISHTHRAWLWHPENWSIPSLMVRLVLERRRFGVLQQESNLKKHPNINVHKYDWLLTIDTSKLYMRDNRRQRAKNWNHSRRHVSKHSVIKCGRLKLSAPTQFNSQTHRFVFSPPFFFCSFMQRNFIVALYGPR